MPVSRLIRSSAFRLTMLYMVLFSLSCTALLAFIYLGTTREMESQIKATINIQLVDLERTMERSGQNETVAAIDHLIMEDRGRNFIYLMLDTRGRVRAGNIDRWPQRTVKSTEAMKFTLMNMDAPDEASQQVLAASTKFKRGQAILVGHKLINIERIRKSIVRVLLVSTFITFFMAVAGGLIFSRYIRRRIDAINQTCRRIMSGELSHRVTVSGSDDEFDHLAMNINAMLIRINELIDGIRDISYNVAHDLRTPLNRLRNRLERLESTQAEGKKSRHEIHAALNDIDQLIATFNAILRIAQAEVGAGIEHFTDVDLSTLVQDVIELYAALAEEKGQSLAYEIEAGIHIKGDRHLLTQAIANLLDNAVKYTPRGGAINVLLKIDASMIRLAIIDNGPGIPPEYHDKVKQKFFRMETSRTSAGNGLGLSLADAAFKLHHATLAFSDNLPGLNATVTFNQMKS